MLLSQGQMSDDKGGAALMLDALPPAKTLLGDRGYDAGWFRNALAERGIVPCIPSKTNRKLSIPHDRTLYQPATQDREHVRQAQGLATHPYPLRPLLPHLFLSHLYRSNRHLLDQTMSPEPSLARFFRIYRDSPRYLQGSASAISETRLRIGDWARFPDRREERKRQCEQFLGPAFWRPHSPFRRLPRMLRKRGVLRTKSS